MPVLESSITLIDGGHLYYRGYDAVELARTRSIAEVASLIALSVSALGISLLQKLKSSIGPRCEMLFAPA